VCIQASQLIVNYDEHEVNNTFKFGVVYQRFGQVRLFSVVVLCLRTILRKIENPFFLFLGAYIGASEVTSRCKTAQKHNPGIYLVPLCLKVPHLTPSSLSLLH